MLDFTKYIYEIYKVSKEKDYSGMDIGTAFSMFLGDIKNGAATPDNTGDILPNFDFAAAKTEWDNMSSDEKDKSLSDIAEIRKDSKLLRSLNELYPDQKAMERAVEDWEKTQEGQE